MKHCSKEFKTYEDEINGKVTVSGKNDLVNGADQSKKTKKDKLSGGPDIRGVQDLLNPAPVSRLIPS